MTIGTIANRAGRRRAALAAGTLACTLAACSAGADASGQDKTFSVGVTTALMAHLSPGKSGGTNIDAALFTPLTSVDTATGKLRHEVASSITSKDNKTWTIKIKKGWTFSNGEKVTAQSFADSWNATAYAPNGFTNNYLLQNFAGYEALNPLKGKPKAKTLSGIKVHDPYTLEVTVNKPLSMLPYVLAQSTFAPMPKAAFKDLEAFDRKPIGNGPFRIKGDGLSSGATGITLEKNPDYAGTSGKAERIDVKTYQDEGAAYRDVQAGTLDVTLVSGSNLTQAAERDRKHLVQVPMPAVVYLGFPLWDKRFADQRVREAFSLAVDRKAIVKSLLGGFGEPARGLAGDNLPGGGAEDCDACTFDPERARQLLDQAGGWKGPLKLWTPQDPTNAAVVEGVANQLRKNLGIEKVATQVQPADQLYPNMAARKVSDPTLLYLAAGYPHMYALVDALFSTGSGTNTTGYESKEFTAALGKAAAAEPEQAAGPTREASATALSTLPVAPLYRPVGGLVHSDRIDGVRPAFLGGVDLAAVTTG